MSYELKAIIEYDAARLEIKEIKKPLYDLFHSCEFENYPYTGNCIKIHREYLKWENSWDDEMDEPEYREPCEQCKKALQIFKDLEPAKKRFGIAKTRISRIARNYSNSTVLGVDEL